MITAKAKEPERIIERIASEYKEKLLLRYSISQAESTATITATHKGLYPATNPTATASYAECRRV
jgi:hypothetical protein